MWVHYRLYIGADGIPDILSVFVEAYTYDQLIVLLDLSKSQGQRFTVRFSMATY